MHFCNNHVRISILRWTIIESDLHLLFLFCRYIRENKSNFYHLWFQNIWINSFYVHLIFGKNFNNSYIWVDCWNFYRNFFSFFFFFTVNRILMLMFCTNLGWLLVTKYHLLSFLVIHLLLSIIFKTEFFFFFFLMNPFYYSFFSSCECGPWLGATQNSLVVGLLVELGVNIC